MQCLYLFKEVLLRKKPNIFFKKLIDQNVMFEGRISSRTKIQVYKETKKRMKRIDEMK